MTTPETGEGGDAVRVRPFAVEEWMNAHERGAVHNLAETCVDSLTLDQLLAMGGSDAGSFFSALGTTKLTYGDIEGSPELRRLLGGLYAERPQVAVTAGAIGANFLVFYSLIGPGDRVAVVHPTYAQLYEVPRAFGADVRLVPLSAERRYLPDMDQLAQAAEGARMIVLNNPNNPTGALMPSAMLEDVVAIARRSGAHILCDEVYRDLLQPGAKRVPSIVDLYERGIATGSMSKVFSLAGLRLGWVATRDAEVMAEMLRHRDYTTISCGMLDDRLAAYALAHHPKILERSLALVRVNLSILADWVAAEPHVTFVRPEAGTTALLAYDLDIPSAELCRRLLARSGTLLTPGSCFDVEHTLRIGYAPATDVLRRGLSCLSACLAEVAGARDAMTAP